MSRSVRASGSSTEKRARPRARAAGAAFLSRLLDHVSDGVIGADRSYHITYWSTGAERLYGYSAAEAVGKTTIELLRPDYAPGERERIIESIEALGSFVATLRTRHKNGTEIVVELNSTRLTDELGATSGYVVVYRDVTERTRDRQALKEAHDRLLAQSDELRRGTETMRGILNATQESIWQFGRDGRVLLANDIALRRMRQPADAVIGRHFTELLAPDLAASRLAKLDEVVESRRIVEFEDERAGMTFRHNFCPVLDRDGSVASVVSFSRDITERKRVEAEILRNRERYQNLIETTGDFVWETDAQGRYTYCSPQMETLWGMKPESMLGKTPFDVMPDEARPGGIVFFQEITRAAKPFAGLESAAILPDGRKIHIETNGVPFFDEHGNLQGFRGISRDITERKKGEAAERVRLAAAIEQASEGVAIMDERGRISYANASFAGLSGRALGEIVSMSYPEFLDGENGGGDTWAAIRASLARGEAWRGRLSRARAGGDIVELEAIVSPIQDAEGRGINYLAIERDVTREVRLQEHLRQVQKMEALGTLAGGIAHDFNNILNPIFISTELLLLDASLAPDDRRHLEVTLKAAERGRDLVKQIIAFSRRKDKEHKPFEAAPVVREAVKFLRVSLPSTIEIRSDIRDDAGLVLGDPAQVHQIVMNLCNNAAYAMRDHGGILTVSLTPEDIEAGRAAAIPGLRPGPQLRLTVSDTGAGMTPEVRERAFDPFFTTKKPGEGSGMGLAVLDGIVRDYGGTVTVESETGRGSRFTVYLPRQVREIAAEEADPESPPRGSERVLLLDDEDVQVRSIRGMLERLGYEVAGFTDGAEALARFRADPRSFDLVITDQTMPQMTGVKFASEILKLRPGMPIVLCTGFSETVDALEAKAQGIREFLMKPYSILEMAVTVRRALTGRPAKAKAKRA